MIMKKTDNFLEKALKDYDEYWNNSFNFFLQWHITNQCNFRCKHCYQTDYKKPILSFKQMELIFENFLQIIEEKRNESLGNKNIIFHLSITGGEPLLYDHFDKLMSKIAQKKKEFQLSIMSKGSLLKPLILKKLFNDYKVDIIQISIEGVEKKNDEIRGKRNFAKAIRALENIKKMGKKSVISFTLNKQNLEDIPLLVKLAYDLKTNISIRRLVLQGAGKNMKELLVSPNELESVYRYIDTINSNSRENGEDDLIFLGCESGIASQFNLKNKSAIIFCLAMTKGILTVLPDGSVYSCRRLPIKIGDLNHENLIDVYHRIAKGEYKIQMDKMPIECQQCQYFNSCFGGSRCVAFSYSLDKDLYAPDPQCSKLFSN